MKNKFKKLMLALFIFSFLMGATTSEATVQTEDKKVAQELNNQFGQFLIMNQTLDDIEEELTEIKLSIGVPGLVLGGVDSSSDALVEQAEKLVSSDSSDIAKVEEIDSGVASEIEKYIEEISAGELDKASDILLEIYSDPSDLEHEELVARKLARKKWFALKVAKLESISNFCRMHLDPQGTAENIDRALMLSVTQADREALSNQVEEVGIVKTIVCDTMQSSLATEVKAMSMLESYLSSTSNVIEKE